MSIDGENLNDSAKKDTQQPDEQKPEASEAGRESEGSSEENETGKEKGNSENAMSKRTTDLKKGSDAISNNTNEYFKKIRADKKKLDKIPNGVAFCKLCNEINFVRNMPGHVKKCEKKFDSVIEKCECGMYVYFSELGMHEEFCKLANIFQKKKYKEAYKDPREEIINKFRSDKDWNKVTQRIERVRQERFITSKGGDIKLTAISMWKENEYKPYKCLFCDVDLKIVNAQKHMLMCYRVLMKGKEADKHKQSQASIRKSKHIDLQQKKTVLSSKKWPNTSVDKFLSRMRRGDKSFALVKTADEIKIEIRERIERRRELLGMWDDRVDLNPPNRYFSPSLDGIRRFSPKRMWNGVKVLSHESPRSLHTQQQVSRESLMKRLVRSPNLSQVGFRKVKATSSSRNKFIRNPPNSKTNKTPTKKNHRGVNFSEGASP